MQKARRHGHRPLRQVVGARFQGLFHSPRGVLFTFPSRYWFAIGLQGVLSLGGWSRLLRAGFHVPRATRDAGWPGVSLRVRGCHPLWPAVPGRSASSPGPSRPSHNPARALTRAVWAGPLSLAATRGVTRLFSPPAATKMFQFAAFAHLSVSPLGGVPPFGHPRVAGCLRLAGEFRRLSRPSSPLGAWASSVRPCLLLLWGSRYSAPPVSLSRMSMCFAPLAGPGGGGAWSAGASRPSRKEVFQPHLPVRLPCYDLAPVIRFALGRSFRSRPSGAPDSHGLTGGVYKARERIHRAMADARLLANPASRGRVADPGPN